VASRTTFQDGSGAKFVLGDEFAPALQLCGGFVLRERVLLLPVHVEDFRLRPEVAFRLAMAFQTPFHLERRGLIDERHFVHAPVARRAPDTFGDMDAVVEIDVIGQVVNARPFNRLIVAPTRPDGFEIGAVAPDLRVAVHTGLRRRYPGVRGSLDRRVAIAAINAVVARMVLVRKLHGLLALVERTRIPRRAIDLGDCPRHEQQDEDRAEDAQLSERVGAAMKNLRHGQYLIPCVTLVSATIVVAVT